MNIDYFNTNISDSISELTSVLLSYVGSLVLIVLIFSGIIYASSGGNPNIKNMAKRAMTYAITGLVIVMSSYAVIKVIDTLAT